MNLKSLLIFIIAASFMAPAFPQLVKVDSFAPRKADTIIIERNWRTRDKIILAELEFGAGDTVTQQILELSLKKLWNLQNFSSVDFRWDSLTDGRTALRLVTRDALTIIPIIGGNLQKNDLRISAGLADHNFLGRNIRLEVRGQYGETEPSLGEIKLTIPRQLLWKNMSIGAAVRKVQFGYTTSDQAFISIVNPFHLDYHYTFSPDLETGFNRLSKLHTHELDDPESGIMNFDYRFWYFRITESVGTITHRRHQEEGYNITAMIGAGFGLTKETTNYFEAAIHAEYNRLISPRLQFSIKWDGNYNPGGYEYLWTRYGPANVRGIEYGDLTGRLMQLASAGLYYTWINRDYLAVEQSLFVQYGSAAKNIGVPSDFKQQYAIGTGFQFTIPMYPAASLLISFSYNPTGKNWFYLEL